MSSLCLQAQEAESLEDVCSDGAPSALSKSTNTASGFLCSARMTDALNRSLSGRTLPHSTGNPGLDAWILSLADSTARTSAQQDEAQESQENAPGSGKKWPGLLAKFDPATSSWRTPQCSLFEDSEPSLEIFPRWGSMRNGELFQRPKSVLPTCGNDSGSKPDGETFFHTLTCNGLDGGSNSRRALLKRMATLKASDGERGGRGDLLMQVRGVQSKSGRYKFPTLTARDWKSGKASPETMEKNSRPLSETVGGMLNPTWCEWFMGFPIGWSELEPLEMRRFRQWLQRHGIACTEEDEA